jgi:NADH-quinone oxidoreductase subunit C
MTDQIRTELERVVAEFQDSVTVVEDLRGDLALRAEREVIHGLVKALRDHPELKFDMLYFITGLDNYLDEPRFEVVYNLRSMERNVDVRINVPVPGTEPELDSITDLYPSADWLEREVWDMFGVRFTNHPNLERILMWEGFEGHPLRKDYPLLGNTPGTPGYLGKGGLP